MLCAVVKIYRQASCWKVFVVKTDHRYAPQSVQCPLRSAYQCSGSSSSVVRGNKKYFTYTSATPPNHGADDYSFALPSAAAKPGPGADYSHARLRFRLCSLDPSHISIGPPQVYPYPSHSPRSLSLSLPAYPPFLLRLLCNTTTPLQHTPPPL